MCVFNGVKVHTVYCSQVTNDTQAQHGHTVYLKTSVQNAEVALRGHLLSDNKWSLNEKDL